MLTKTREISQLLLQRYPPAQDKSLRAWNAADELLLEHLQQNLKNQPENCLIINDQFGALTTALNDISPIFWSDSYLSSKAIQNNLQRNYANNIHAKPLTIDYQHLNQQQTIAKNNPKQTFSLVLLRIPKHNSLLSFQLNQLKSLINSKTIIVAAGMSKEIHTSTLSLFEKIIGPTKTSLAKKKARLIFSQLDSRKNVENNESDEISLKQNFSAQYYLSQSYLAQYHLTQHQLNIFGLPGVFSREKLDIGSQVLLQHLPFVAKNSKVIDLGCGNGVIAAVIAKQQPDCQLLLTDESRLAIESAKLTFKNNLLDNSHNRAQFIQTDILQGVTDNNFDYVFCNPPFHQQNVQTLTIAKSMFKQASQKLKQTGELYVVANRHLPYFSHLKRYFNQVESISKDPKFIVWRASSPKLVSHNNLPLAKPYE